MTDHLCRACGRPMSVHRLLCGDDPMTATGRFYAVEAAWARLLGVSSHPDPAIASARSPQYAEAEHDFLTAARGLGLGEDEIVVLRGLLHENGGSLSAALAVHS